MIELNSKVAVNEHAAHVCGYIDFERAVEEDARPISIRICSGNKSDVLFEYLAVFGERNVRGLAHAEDIPLTDILVQIPTGEQNVMT